MAANDSDSGWHLDKRVPLALIMTLVFQTAGVIWWASAVNARVEALELRAAKAEAASDDIAAVKARLDSVDQRSQRIEDKVDRLIERDRG